MIFNNRIKKAIEISALIHKKQFRKGTETPYVTHTFSAFLIGSKFTDDENTLVAILLHDGPEDTEYSFEDISRDFGDNVCEIVRGVTKDRKDAKLPWEEKEKRYLEGLKKAPDESMIVCASDKIHNMMSTIEEYDGEKFWKRFSVQKERKIRYYENVLDVIKKRISGGIIEEYEETLSKMKEIVK